VLLLALEELVVAVVDELEVELVGPPEPDVTVPVVEVLDESSLLESSELPQAKAKSPTNPNPHPPRYFMP
jgi:hypothetical protein